MKNGNDLLRYPTRVMQEVAAFVTLRETRACHGTALLLALPILFSAGCIKRDLQKLPPSDPGVTTEAVASVVLRDGREVEFGPGGGRFELIGSVAGVTRDGDTASLASSSIRELRLVSPPLLDPESTGNRRIVEAIDRDGYFYHFDSTRGRLDRSKGTLEGRLVTGTDAELRADRVRYIRTDPVPSFSLLELSRRPDTRVAEVVVGTVSGSMRRRLVVFNEAGGRLVGVQEAIVGESLTGVHAVFPIDSILYANVSRVNVVTSVLSTVGVIALGVGVVALIAIATKESCPFVYSYDGSQYVFDAEPLGGATTEVLARTDFSKLEHLRPHDGVYRLLVRNEVAETQYLDAMKVRVVDHDSGSSPVFDVSGEVQLVRQPQSPVSATTEDGVSILRHVASLDGVAWQTHLPSVSSPESVRHTLTFAFPKPSGARKARVVANLGTTLWGSAMIRHLYELRGDDVDRWHAAVDQKGPELNELLEFVEREEMFALKVLVRRGTEWAHRGYLLGGGPFVHETQLLSLSLSGMEGDSLVLRLRPPLGFWSVDYIGVEFDPGPGATSVSVPLHRAVDQDGRDITTILEAEDRSYSVMPTTRHSSTLEFLAPPACPGKARTVFLETSGYYRLNLPRDAPQNTALLHEVTETPGAVVRFSLLKFREWYDGARAAALSASQ